MSTQTAISGGTFIQRCGCPMVAETFRVRIVAAVIASMGAAQLVASSFHVGLPCAFYATTGIPCPGCGLTRSVLALVHGHAVDSVRWHPFGPLLLAGLVTALLATVMPEKVRRPMLNAIDKVERKTALVAVLLVLFGLFWIVRVAGIYPLPPFPDWHIPLAAAG